MIILKVSVKKLQHSSKQTNSLVGSTEYVWGKIGRVKIWFNFAKIFICSFSLAISVLTTVLYIINVDLSVLGLSFPSINTTHFTPAYSFYAPVDPMLSPSAEI